MAERARGGGFGWFIVGLLAGIALTLGGLAFFNINAERGRYVDRPEEAPTAQGTDAASTEAASHAARSPTAEPAPAVAAAPPVAAPAAPPAQDKAAARAVAAQAADDAQMQEDAAAAGNTARAKPPE
jgi:predicted lipid-binding transport protein (Tim44 family)